MYEMTKERAMELSAHSRFGCQMVAKDIKDTPLAKDKDVCIQVVSRYGLRMLWPMLHRDYKTKTM